MASTSTTESSSASFARHVSYLSGRWLAHDSMQIGVNDVGFRQGVTAVERLRTYHGRLFALDEHLVRWQRSVTQLSIAGLPSELAIRAIIEDLLARNSVLLRSEGDVGLTMFATPGELGGDGPTLGLHLNRLNHAVHQRRREQGQPLVVTSVRQPDPDCWPRSIKVRSRVHYYRADAIARAVDENAVGILLDNDGSVTETSIANLAIVQAGRIVSPPADRVLPGITQSVVESIAAAAAIPWSNRAITVAELQQAEEVLLMGTDGGIWFASSIDDQRIGNGSPAEVYRCLRDRFDALVAR